MQSSPTINAGQPRSEDEGSDRRSLHLPMMVLVALLALLAVLASGCTGGGDSGAAADSESQVGDDSSQTDQSQTDQSGTETTGADQDGDSSSGSASGSASGTADDGNTDENGGSNQDGSTDSTGAAIPELCGVDEVNRQPFYAVDSIPADDPDGGLNLRTSFEGGDVIETLEAGTVVAAQDCYRADDGGVWYAVQTLDQAGWVNARFLGQEISPLVATYGGTETEALVVALLDALAAKEWDTAAGLLTVGDPGFIPAAGQLDSSDLADLAESLQAYCATRICDAPYAVVEVRGSYVPDAVQPEVDVEFIYSGGVVTETFGRVVIGEDTAVDSLPGRSILSLASSTPSTSELVDQPDAGDQDLYEAAERIRMALLSELGPRIPADHLADEGVVVSPDAYIDPESTQRYTVTESDLDSGSAEVRIWGYQDGTGWPIVDSVEGFLATYRRSAALLEPDVVGVDRRVGQGNTLDNLTEQFPNARIVEFHREGRGEAASFNWSSVRMALELRDGTWQLVGLSSDSWTI